MQKSCIIIQGKEGKPLQLNGRRMILTDETEVTRENVVQILNEALFYHVQNRSEIDYLWKYYKGWHPVLNRTKEYRPEINNKIVVNIPYEVVTFDTGYLMGEPVQYISRGNETISDDIDLLNRYMLSEEMFTKDKELADWFHICGTSYKMVLPDDEIDYSPFEIDIPDPRSTFVVYNNGFGNRPILGVRYVTDSKGVIHYSCYSKDRYFEITNLNSVIYEGTHDLGDVPIVEYPLNKARLGAFEVVLDLCDAIDTADSNRLDGVEQFVQSLMLFHNMDISSDDFSKLKELGAIKFKDIDPQMKASVQYLTSELNQTETQTLVDHMYQMILTICGIPNRQGSATGGDNGLAVIYRDGWSTAEVNAKNAEASYKRSERRLLRIITRICNRLRPMNLIDADIDIHFTRRNYENTLTKSQVLTTMLSNEKIHPKLAFTHSGMFVDPDLAYNMSKEYADAHKSEPVQGTDNGDRSDPQEGVASGTADRTGTDSHS